METGGVPSGLFYGGIAAWITREVWGVLFHRKKDRTEISASASLVAGLADRIRMLEESQQRLEMKLREEMELRMSAQEQAHELMLDVLALKAKLRGLGVAFDREGE